MTTDGIEETVHNPHLKERIVITILLDSQQVEFFDENKVEPTPTPPLLLHILATGLHLFVCGS